MAGTAHPPHFVLPLKVLSMFLLLVCLPTCDSIAGLRWRGANSRVSTCSQYGYSGLPCWHSAPPDVFTDGENLVDQRNSPTGIFYATSSDLAASSRYVASCKGGMNLPILYQNFLRPTTVAGTSFAGYGESLSNPDALRVSSVGHIGMAFVAYGTTYMEVRIEHAYYNSYALADYGNPRLRLHWRIGAPVDLSQGNSASVTYGYADYPFTLCYVTEGGYCDANDQVHCYTSPRQAFDGSYCESRHSPSDSCQSGLYKYELYTGYYCDCFKSSFYHYHGPKCQYRFQCGDGCRSGATCDWGGNCNCSTATVPEGYVLINALCEIQRLPDTPYHVPNCTCVYGTCNADGSCDCSSTITSHGGWGGIDCSEEFQCDGYGGDSCLNGGLCIAQDSCQCFTDRNLALWTDSPLTGSGHCQTDYNAYFACFNGGRRVGIHTCECRGGFTGPHCEYPPFSLFAPSAGQYFFATSFVYFDSENNTDVQVGADDVGELSFQYDVVVNMAVGGTTSYLLPDSSGSSSVPDFKVMDRSGAEVKSSVIELKGSVTNATPVKFAVASSTLTKESPMWVATNDSLFTDVFEGVVYYLIDLDAPAGRVYSSVSISVTSVAFRNAAITLRRDAPDVILERVQNAVGQRESQARLDLHYESKARTNDSSDTAAWSLEFPTPGLYFLTVTYLQPNDIPQTDVLIQYTVNKASCGSDGGSPCFTVGQLDEAIPYVRPIQYTLSSCVVEEIYIEASDNVDIYVRFGTVPIVGSGSSSVYDYVGTQSLTITYPVPGALYVAVDSDSAETTVTATIVEYRCGSTLCNHETESANVCDINTEYCDCGCTQNNWGQCMTEYRGETCEVVRCEDAGSCSECVSDAGCQWCEEKSTCISGSPSSRLYATSGSVACDANYLFHLECPEVPRLFQELLEEPSPPQSSPPSRFMVGESSTTCGDVLYVFGGWEHVSGTTSGETNDNSGGVPPNPLTDFWAYSLEQRSWTSLPLPDFGDDQPRSYAHLMCWEPSTLVLFGGAKPLHSLTDPSYPNYPGNVSLPVFDNPTQEVRIFDIESEEWTRLTPDCGSFANMGLAECPWCSDSRCWSAASGGPAPIPCYWDDANSNVPAPRVFATTAPFQEGHRSLGVPGFYLWGGRNMMLPETCQGAYETSPGGFWMFSYNGTAGLWTFVFDDYTESGREFASMTLVENKAIVFGGRIRRAAVLTDDWGVGTFNIDAWEEPSNSILVVDLSASNPAWVRFRSDILPSVIAPFLFYSAPYLYSLGGLGLSESSMYLNSSDGGGSSWRLNVDAVFDSAGRLAVEALTHLPACTGCLAVPIVATASSGFGDGVSLSSSPPIKAKDTLMFFGMESQDYVDMRTTDRNRGKGPAFPADSPAVLRGSLNVLERINNVDVMAWLQDGGLALHTMSTTPSGRLVIVGGVTHVRDLSLDRPTRDFQGRPRLPGSVALYDPSSEDAIVLVGATSSSDDDETELPVLAFSSSPAFVSNVMYVFGGFDWRSTFNERSRAAPCSESSSPSSYYTNGDGDCVPPSIDAFLWHSEYVSSSLYRVDGLDDDVPSATWTLIETIEDGSPGGMVGGVLLPIIDGGGSPALYYHGGHGVSDTGAIEFENTRKVFTVSLSTETWTSFTTLKPISTAYSGVTALEDGRIASWGGLDENYNPVSDIYLFTPSSALWQKVVTSRAAVAPVLFNAGSGLIMAVGGLNEDLSVNSGIYQLNLAVKLTQISESGSSTIATVTSWSPVLSGLPLNVMRPSVAVHPASSTVYFLGGSSVDGNSEGMTAMWTDGMALTSIDPPMGFTFSHQSLTLMADVGGSMEGRRAFCLFDETIAVAATVSASASTFTCMSPLWTAYETVRVRLLLADEEEYLEFTRVPQERSFFTSQTTLSYVEYTYVGCGKGFFARVASAACQPCEAGTAWNGTNKLDSCDPCSEGTFAAESGAESCAVCEAGHKWISAQLCEPCEPGTYSTEGSATECTLCTDVEYQPEAGMTACLPCPLNTIVVGSSHEALTDCVCASGFFGEPGSEACVACPDFTSCPTPDSRSPVALPGYWYDGETGSVVTCLPASACLGANECAEGYAEAACTTCADRYYRLSGLCEPCPKNSILPLVLAGIVLLATVGVLLRFSRGLNSSSSYGVVGIAFNYIQVVAVFVAFKMNWPPVVLRLFALFSVLNLNINLASPECAVPVSDALMWGTMMATPFIFLALFGLVWLMSSAYAMACTRWLSPAVQATTWSMGPCNPLFGSVTPFKAMASDYWRLKTHNYIHGFLLFLSLVYIFLVQNSVYMLTCTAFGDGTYRLRDNAEFLCYTPEWRRLFPIAVVGLILYGGGIPALFAYILFVLYKRSVTSEDNMAIFKARYGFLTTRYERSYFYWELVVTLRKLAIVMATIFFNSQLLLQNLIALFVVFASVLTQLYARPFAFSKDDRLESVLLFTSFVVLLCGILFSTGSLENSGAVGPLAVFTVVILVASLVCIVGYVVMETIFILRTYQYTKLSRDPVISRLLDASTTILTDGGRFRILKWLDEAHPDDIQHLHDVFEEIDGRLVESFLHPYHPDLVREDVYVFFENLKKLAPDDAAFLERVFGQVKAAAAKTEDVELTVMDDDGDDTGGGGGGGAAAAAAIASSVELVDVSGEGDGEGDDGAATESLVGSSRDSTPKNPSGEGSSNVTVPAQRKLSRPYRDGSLK